MIDWNEIWVKAGYTSEKDMWDHLYITNELGMIAIGKLLGVSGPSIGKRLKLFKYKIKDKGGDPIKRALRFKRLEKAFGGRNRLNNWRDK